MRFDLPTRFTSLLGAGSPLLLLHDDDRLLGAVSLNLLDDVEPGVPNGSLATKSGDGRVDGRRLLGRGSSTSALTIASGQTEDDEGGVLGRGSGSGRGGLSRETRVTRGVSVLPVNGESEEDSFGDDEKEKRKR